MGNASNKHGTIERSVSNPAAMEKSANKAAKKSQTSMSAPLTDEHRDITYSPTHRKLVSKFSLNLHEVQPDIKIHSVASEYLDPDHESSLMIPLGEVTDEQLLAEVARRRLDIHHNITEALVRESYIFESHIGHGASGEVFLVTNRFSNEKFACKVVRKDSTINDAKSMSTEIEIMKRIRHRNIVSLIELYEVNSVIFMMIYVLIVCIPQLHYFLRPVAKVLVDYTRICEWRGYV